jgi:hypothetical protein
MGQVNLHRYHESQDTHPKVMEVIRHPSSGLEEQRRGWSNSILPFHFAITALSHQNSHTKYLDCYPVLFAKTRAQAKAAHSTVSSTLMHSGCVRC